MSMTGDIEILGCKLKLKADNESAGIGSGISPDEVIELLEREIHEIRKHNPALDDNKTAVLVALKLASEKIELEQEFRDQIEKFEKATKDALDMVNLLTPQE